MGRVEESLPGEEAGWPGSPRSPAAAWPPRKHSLPGQPRPVERPLRQSPTNIQHGGVIISHPIGRLIYGGRSFEAVKNPALVKAFGEHLRALRKQGGFSQQALADEADLSWPTVQRVEAGTQSATLDVLGSLARALRIPLALLVTFPVGDGLGDGPPS